MELGAFGGARMGQEETAPLDHEDVLDLVANLLGNRERLEVPIEDGGGCLVECPWVRARQEHPVARGDEVSQRIQETHDSPRRQVIPEVLDALERDDGLGLRRNKLADEPLE